MRVAVIVPTLNEEEAIGAVVAEAGSVANAKVFVIDNASTDGTATVAQAAGATVVSEPRRGYGFACQAGVKAAAEGFDVLVFMDGDGSDDGLEIQRLLDPLVMGEADLVLGSRRLAMGDRGALMPHQRVGNALTVGLIRLLYRRRITDLPPMKAIRPEVLASLDMCEMTYGWTVEMIVKCLRGGYRVVELPVTSRCRMGGSSKVSGTVKGTLLAGYFLVKTTLKHAF